MCADGDPRHLPIVGVDQGAPWSGEVLPLEPVEEYRRWRPWSSARSPGWSWAAAEGSATGPPAIPTGPVVVGRRDQPSTPRQPWLGLDHNGAWIAAQ